MFIELVDSLRCVVPHDDTWLVAAADRMEGRHIMEGTLGCPTCRAAYVISGGVAWLGADPAVPAPDAPFPVIADAEGEAMRLAALLDLREPGARALLGGERGRLAAALAALTGAELLLIDPPPEVRAGAGLSILRTAGQVPLAGSSVRAAAVDETLVGALEGVMHAVRDRGRVVAPAHAPLPAESTELARDERDWVAERRPRPSPPVQLTVVRGGGGKGGR